MVDRNKKAKEELKHKSNLKKAGEVEAQRAFLDMQQKYIKTVLARLYQGAQLVEIRNQLEKGPITMLWYGIPFPKPILTMEHELIQNTYKDLISEEEYLKQGLVGLGLTLEQINEVLEHGKIFKEVPIIKEESKEENRKV